MCKVLWADDDGCSVLAPIGFFLRRQKFTVVAAGDYRAAVDALDNLDLKNGGLSDVSLLVDVILPHHGQGALSSRLGIRVAEIAAGRGVQRICLLSVIPVEEVDEAIEELRQKFDKTTFTFIWKLDLLEPNQLEALIRALRA